MLSTYITWQKVCKYHGVPQSDWNLNGQYNYIEFKNGSRVDLLDLKLMPSDPLYERYGSQEYSDGSIEEAGEVEFLAKDVLGIRIGRHMNDEVRPTMVITGNPKKNWTYRYYYKPWKEGTLPNNIEFVQSLYGDNPHTAEVYGKQLAALKDKATKQRLKFGNWEYDDDVGTMISYDAIIDLFTNTIDSVVSAEDITRVIEPEKYLVVDVARLGVDKTVFSYWKGFEEYKIETFVKQDTAQTSEKLKQALKEERIPYSHCIADEDGIGGGVVDQVRGIKGFVANSSPKVTIEKEIELKRQDLTKENYKSLKSQCGFLLAKLVNNHKISISADISESMRNEIVEELEQLKAKDVEKDAPLQLIPKEEIKENIGRSPDFLDTMLMRMYFELEEPIPLVTPQASSPVVPYYGDRDVPF